MRRIAGLALLLAAAITSPLAEPAPATASTTTTNATAYQSSPRHDGLVTDTAFHLPLSKAWSTDLGGVVHYPLVVGNRLVVDTASPDSRYGTTLAAYDLDSGRRLWGPLDMGGFNGFGALTYDRGRVFQINADGRLSALDLGTGARVWTVELHTSDQSGFDAAPTASGGRVHVTSLGTGGRLYAFDETNGALLWEQPVAYSGGESAPTIGGGRVYLSYSCEQTYAFDASTGAPLWHHQTPCTGGGGTTSAFHAGRLYVRDNAGMGPEVLDAATGDPVGVFSSGTAPAVSGSWLVTQTGSVLRSEHVSSGLVTWTNTGRFWASAPLLVNGLVVEGAEDGTVAALDVRTGRTAWTGAAAGPVNPPGNGELVGLAEGNGHLVVPSGTGVTVFRSAG